MPDFSLKAEPGKQELTLTYEFSAPAERVFKAMTDRTMIPKWWGPRKYVTIVDKQEVKVGGVWRYLNRDAEGNEYGFHGVYHLIEAPRRIVQTFEFEGAPGHVSLESMTLGERNGRTLATAHSVFQSVEARDGMMQGDGMEAGARETYERLEELAARM